MLLSTLTIVDTSDERQQVVADPQQDDGVAVPQARFSDPLVMLVPPPHLFGGSLKTARLALANWLPLRGHILDRIDSLDNVEYIGVTPGIWRRLVQGKVYRVVNAVQPASKVRVSLSACRTRLTHVADLRCFSGLRRWEAGLKKSTWRPLLGL